MRGKSLKPGSFCNFPLKLLKHPLKCFIKGNNFSYDKTHFLRPSNGQNQFKIIFWFLTQNEDKIKKAYCKNQDDLKYEDDLKDKEHLNVETT